MAAGGGTQKLYVEDVFSAYTYTGNGATQTITNGIDLAGKGGMVWSKSRSNSLDHALFDTTRGITNYLNSDNTQAQDGLWGAQSNMLTAANSNGFSLGADTNTGAVNGNGYTFVSWTFRQANKFYTQALVSHTTGTATTVDLSSLGTVGMVTVKATNATSNWYTWHISLTAGDLVYLNTTAAQTADTTISVSGTTLTISSAAATASYIVYAWAHDTSTTGLIQCGSFTCDSSGNASVTLGWEPQYLVIKGMTTATSSEIMDSSRGFSLTAVNILHSDVTNSEAISSPPLANPTATGFKVNNAWASQTVIYLAIRRGPMKTPTSGTQVYNAIARTGTGAAATVTGVGFPPDLVVPDTRNTTVGAFWWDRLRGYGVQNTSATAAAETTTTNALTSFDMDGISVGADGNNYINGAFNYINWFFRRAPGVFDEVCYTGTGTATTVNHNLGVVPELMIVKCRSLGIAWAVYAAPLTNTDYLVLNTAAARTSASYYWNNTTPTSSVFSLGNGSAVNSSGATYVAYLFATLAGVSKVGSYTGNGTSLSLNMGFSAGARFFLCKRTDSSGDWFVWDSVRGINGASTSDPHLSLNTTAAEVDTTDDVDPYTSGITVNQNSTTNINVNAATYVFLAFS
jgi:hypothetical protein